MYGLNIDITGLKNQVQKNCDISDANYAGVYSLCGLLLRLRDLHKWERGLEPWEEPEPRVLLEWVDARETYWGEIASESILPITIGERSFDPFDIDSINGLLRPTGMIYGAGYGIGMKPTFFLAEVKDSTVIGGIKVDRIERELARDIFMTPAMRRGDQIFARRLPMLFFLWDQILELRPSAKEPLTYALAQYGLEPEALRRNARSQGPELKKVANEELDTWIHHEMGEAGEKGFEGDIWHEIVAAYSNSPVEIYARVVKDFLADTHAQGLLGHIVRERRKSSFGFYLAFMRPFMRTVFPEAHAAFCRFKTDGDWSRIEAIREAGHEKAHRLAHALIRLHRSGTGDNAEEIRDRIVSELIEPLGIKGPIRGNEQDDD